MKKNITAQRAALANTVLALDGEGPTTPGVLLAANSAAIKKDDYNAGLTAFVNGLLVHPAARAAHIAKKAAAAANAGAAAANDAGFSDAFFSEPLTSFLVGWKDPYATLEFLNSIAPQIPVGRRYEFKATDNDQAFLSESDDVRALDAEFKEVRYTQSTTLGQTKNKGLTILIDRDRVAAFGPMYQERYAAWLTQRIFRNEIRRAITGRAIEAARAQALPHPAGFPEELIVSHTVAASLTLMAWWLEHPGAMDRDRLAEALNRLALAPTAALRTGAPPPAARSDQ